VLVQLLFGDRMAFIQIVVSVVITGNMIQSTFADSILPPLIAHWHQKQKYSQSTTKSALETSKFPSAPTIAALASSILVGNLFCQL
jgi:hypothetical protein